MPGLRPSKKLLRYQSRKLLIPNKKRQPRGCLFLWHEIYRRAPFERDRRERFLRLMGPSVPKVLRFDGPLARGLWYRPAGDAYEVSVTGLPSRCISHSKHDGESATSDVFPTPARAVVRFSINWRLQLFKRRPLQPSAAKPLSILRTLGAKAPSNLRTLTPARACPFQKNLRTSSMRRFLYSTETSSILKFSSFPAIS